MKRVIGHNTTLTLPGQAHSSPVICVSTPTLSPASDWIERHLDRGPAECRFEIQVTHWNEDLINEMFAEVIERTQSDGDHRHRNRPTQSNPTNPRKKR